MAYPCDSTVQGSSNSKPSEHLSIIIGGNVDKYERHNSQQLNRIKTTKYTLLTFLPINIWDQFRRAVYFYFLVVTIISFFVNSTMSPLVSLIPLLFVMIVTGVKEAYDDYKRSRNDNLVNNAKVTVYRCGKDEQIESRYVCPGDLVVVTKSDNDVPCDLVLLHCSNGSGKCHVTTANLDGETNLKTLRVPSGLMGENLNNLIQNAEIQCEIPKTDLYSFTGKIVQMNSTTVIPLNTENLLLRGAKLKNTDRIIGCAVYTGMHTKLQLNSRYTGNKSASSEVYINRFLIFLVILMVVTCIVLYVIGRYQELHKVPLMDYLGPPIRVNEITNIIEEFLAFLILFNYMIPISMYMNIEIYRVLNAFFIQQDQHLYDPLTDQRAEVNSSNLNEDLGQINILFSDKTGTLTKNEMVFQKCSIGGRKYFLEKNALKEVASHDIVNIKRFHANQFEFFKALALCHTAQVLQTSNKMEHKQSDTLQYEAASPDEKALLEACAEIGFQYLGDDDDDFIKLEISSTESNGGEILKYKRLNFLEFSSERKRMSVIVSDMDNNKWLYAKGAENVIFELCSTKSREMIAITNQHITEFASEGLRTMAIARKQLTEYEYETYFRDIKLAHEVLNGRRQELLQNCYQIMERDLELLGATAVEDALQDDVNKCLESLQQAGIKIWVLTGDKVETAVNIAFACGHFSKECHKHFMVDIETDEDFLKSLAQLDTKFSLYANIVLVMDGSSVKQALALASKEFLSLALRCQAVLCCRLNPLQKSEIVLLMKKQKHFLTAAVGDGANDVSMIQEADLGIGIMGREGLQAARCSDFAIAKFSMLQRLLLVHGHYNTVRLSFLVLFYCYKNILITGIMVLYQLYDLYSSTSVYHSLYMWLFDVIYISFSFTFLAISEKPYTEEVLMSEPELYKNNRQNRQVRWSIFLRWILNGAFHSLVVFYFAYFFLIRNNVILNEGQTADFYIFGSMCIQLVVVVGNLKLMLESHYKSYIYLAIIVASFIGFIVSTIVYNFINIPHNTGLYHAYNRLFCSLAAWLFTLVTAIACLIPDYTLKVLQTIIGTRNSLKEDQC